MSGRDAINIIQIARENYQTDELQISTSAKVARAEGGDWVEAWIWIPTLEENKNVPENVVSIFGKKDTKTKVLPPTSK